MARGSYPFNYDQRNRFYFFISSKSSATGITLPPSSNGIILICRSGINNSCIISCTKWTFHTSSSVSFIYVPSFFRSCNQININQNNIRADLYNMANGITYSVQEQKQPNNLPGPGTINASTLPLQESKTMSDTKPRRLQSLQLITSRCFKSENLITPYPSNTVCIIICRISFRFPVFISIHDFPGIEKLFIFPAVFYKKHTFFRFFFLVFLYFMLQYK